MARTRSFIQSNLMEARFNVHDSQQINMKQNGKVLNDFFSAFDLIKMASYLGQPCNCASLNPFLTFDWHDVKMQSMHNMFPQR